MKRTDARSEMLRAIRENLGSSPPGPLAGTESSPPGPLSVPERGDVDLVTRFTDQLTHVGAAWTIVRGEAEAAQVLARVLIDAGARHVAGSDAPLVRRLLQGLGDPFVLYFVERLSRDDLFACDAGVTSAQCGIAETGTLVLKSARERNRLLSLVPPVHVALLSTTAICDSLGDALARVREPDPSGGLASRAITFITGPSRTSDIELTPVIGVHGPQTVHVLLLEESP